MLCCYIIKGKSANKYGLSKPAKLSRQNGTGGDWRREEDSTNMGCIHDITESTPSGSHGLGQVEQDSSLIPRTAVFSSIVSPVCLLFVCKGESVSIKMWCHPPPAF